MGDKIEARKIARELGFKGGKNLRQLWQKAYKEGKIPKNLPSDLYSYGKEQKRLNTNSILLKMKG